MSDYNVVSGNNSIKFQNKSNIKLIFKSFIDLDPMKIKINVLYNNSIIEQYCRVLFTTDFNESLDITVDKNGYVESMPIFSDLFKIEFDEEYLLKYIDGKILIKFYNDDTIPFNIESIDCNNDNIYNFMYDRYSLMCNYIDALIGYTTTKKNPVITVNLS